MFTAPLATPFFLTVWTLCVSSPLRHRLAAMRTKTLRYQNMNNALLDALSNYLCGGLLVSCLTDEELARVSLSCHVALDFTCDNWNWFSARQLSALGCEQRKRPSDQSPDTSCHCLDVVQFCFGDHDICHWGETNLDWSAHLSTTSVVFSLRWIVAFFW